MNFAGASLTVPRRGESSLRYSLTFTNSPPCPIRSALSAVVSVQIALEAAERVVPERFAVDRDEHDGALPRPPICPDYGRHGSGALVDPLPYAAGRPEIPPARRRLALAFLEPILRECIHDVFRRGTPPVLRFEPGHPALRAKRIEAAQECHLLLAVNLRSFKGRIGGGSRAEPPPGAHLPAPIETAKLTVSSRYDDGIYANSRRISFSFFAFSATAGNSTSRDWIVSCPGSSRSLLPYVANLKVGSVLASSSLMGCPWASM